MEAREVLSIAVGILLLVALAESIKTNRKFQELADLNISWVAEEIKRNEG